MYCAEVFQNLENVFVAELNKLFGEKVSVKEVKNGIVYFETNVPFEDLFLITTATTISIVFSYEKDVNTAINKTKLLGITRFVIKENTEMYGFKVFETLRLISNAGYEKQFLDIKNFLAIKNGLIVTSQAGDLFIRKPNDKEEIWIRISPRPLSTRFWREADFKAALNASIAAAMVQLSEPAKGDNVLNVCAGSGTLLIERCLANPEPEIALGIELVNKHIEYAELNIKEAELSENFKVIQGDCTRMEHIVKEKFGEDFKFNCVVGDLPFGLAVGNKDENRFLYKKILLELRKICTLDARILLITQDVKSIEWALKETGDIYEVKKQIQTKLSTNRDGLYLYPIIYDLRFKKI